MSTRSDAHELARRVLRDVQVAVGGKGEVVRLDARELDGALPRLPIRPDREVTMVSVDVLET